MKINGNVLTADEGKVFRRKADKMVYGDKVVLGYTHYIGGEKLKEPHLDTAEDFEETEAEEG